MGSPEPIARLSSRAPPTPVPRSFFERLAITLFLDLYGGEAEESKSYLQSLPSKNRPRALARAEERAEAVHRTVLTALACIRVLMVAASSLVIAGIALFLVLFAADGDGLSGLRRVGLIGMPPSIVLGVATWAWKRRRRSGSGGQENSRA